MANKLKTHVQRWNKWRKSNRNGRIYQTLVLLGIYKSQTFMLTLTAEEEQAFYQGLLDALNQHDERSAYDN